MAVDDEAPQSTVSETSHHTISAIDAGEEEEEVEVNDTPIEQVRLTVPPTDNPNLPVLTFRAWFLGIMACALLAFLNQFFGYRENGLSVSAVAAQIVTLPLGMLMAATLPTKKFCVPFLKWKFSLNPGPFNRKEHVLITIFANSGSNGAYALSIVTIMKAFYHRGMNPVAAFLLVQTTMLLGYGWAGMYRKILVDSPYMWWPGNMINISLFRTLHDDEKRQKGGLTRLQFFLVAFTASFAYYVFPAYFIPSISTISIGCFIWKKSVLAQQLTSGLHGLGIGSFSLDWNAVVSFLGNPLGIPSFAIINTMVGFIVVLYIIIPAVHWTNTYDAKKFPLISSHVFDSTGQRYNTTRVLNQKTFDLNAAAYDSYSKLYLSTTFALNYGFSFATLTAAISHVILFYGRSIMRHWSQTTVALREKDGDVHTRLMKKNYKAVPNWWFHSILAVVFGLSLLTCEGFGKQIQLPWWGLILACAIAFFFTLPLGIIQAITNQPIGLNVITELVIGYLYPGKPLANVTFKTYGYISMTQALYFLGDFKLGHYMKIPPKSMFVVQLAGTIVACSVQFSTAWWLLTTVKNICTPSLLPMGSPWTCPGDDVFYNASIIWGVIGPKRMFTRLGVYPELNLFFLIGLLAPVPVWFFSRKYPEKQWIKLINMPLIFGATSNMPPARAVNYWMWGGVGLFFSHYVYKQHKQWWAKHAYILGAGLDAGIAFMAILLYVTLQGKGIFGPNWWGLDNDDHCPLATCPTAPGIQVEGCPVY